MSYAPSPALWLLVGAALFAACAALPPKGPEPARPVAMPPEDRLAALLAQAIDQGNPHGEFPWDDPKGNGPDDDFVARVSRRALALAHQGGPYYSGARWTFTQTKGPSSTRLSISVDLSYRFPNASIVQKMREADLAAEKAVAQVVTASMDDFGREAALHDWLVARARYDWAGYRSGTVPPSGYTPYGVLVEGLGVCESYATAFQLLAEKAGLACRTVRGTADGAPHSWNQVRVDGRWYNLDVTWDDPVGGPDRVTHDYFNVDDAVLSSRHSWDPAEAEACDATEANWYSRQGLLCPDVGALATFAAQALRDKKTTLTCRIETFAPASFQAEVTDALKKAAARTRVSVRWTTWINPDTGVVDVEFGS